MPLKNKRFFELLYLFLENVFFKINGFMFKHNAKRTILIFTVFVFKAIQSMFYSTAEFEGLQ